MINKLYKFILSNQFFAAFATLIPFIFIKDNPIRELSVLLIISVLYTLVIKEKYKFKQILCFSISFCFLFMFLELIQSFFILKNSLLGMFPSLFYYGNKLAIGIIFRFILRFLFAVFILFGVNRILIKLMNIKQLEKGFKFLSDAAEKPFKFFAFIFIIVIIPFIIQYFTGVKISSEDFENIYPYKENTIQKILQNGYLLCNIDDNYKIFDLNTKTFTDEIKINNPLKNNGYKVKHTQYKELQNGNIVIIEYLENEAKLQKAYITIYSRDKKMTLQANELPEFLSDYRTAMEELPNDNLMFIGGRDNKNTFKTTYIYNLSDNSIKQGPDLNKERYLASTIVLNNGNIFVFSGEDNSEFPFNTAEIYDIKNNIFKEVKQNFISDDYPHKVNLFKLSDGRILISCTYLTEDENEGYGSYHGFKTGENKFASVYTIPYITIFNPEDNSFTPININKGSKYLRSNYGITVTKDDKILIICGEELIKTKTRVRIKDYPKNILIYDIKTGKIKKTFGKMYLSRINPTVGFMDENHLLILSGSVDWGKNPNREIITGKF